MRTIAMTFLTNWVGRLASLLVWVSLLAAAACSDEPAATAGKPDSSASDTAVSDGTASETTGSDATAEDTAGDTAGDVATCPASCDDKNPCTADECDTASGTCSHTPASGTCDDGDPCTTGDKCDAGACQPGANTCGCTSSSDCAAIGAKNQCAGKWYCDDTALPYACKVMINTAITCPAPADPCQIAKCVEPGDPKGQPAAPSCASFPAPDGTACNDGNAGTTGDTCQAGVCAGTDVAQCTKNADCAKLEDGDVCNGTLFCNKLKQKCEVNPKTVVVCPSAFDSVCGKNTCDPKSGQCAMQALNDNQPCDDGNPCSGGDHCLGGGCVSTSNTCTCSSDADCAGKDDGNLCNGTMYCNLALSPPVCTVNPATLVSCKSVDDTACTKNVCDPKTGQCGMTPVSTGAPCDDSNPCTALGTCQQGACTVGANICPCQSDGECDGKDDGNLCNGTLYCDKTEHECVLNPATVVTCPTVKNTDCQVNTCAAKTGQCDMVLAADGAPCQDGSVCTANDACKSGTCTPGIKICACELAADCTPLEDGNACNGTLFCDLNVHKCVVNPATVPQEGDLCDDGDACTKLDGCASGLCAGKAVSCDDNNPCTTDACDKTSGCSHTSMDSGACSDNNPCTENDACAAGKCAGTAKVCDDKNPCTKDSCVSWSGSCTVEGLADGTACDDGKPCTSGDKCAFAQCKGKIGACACKGASECFDNDYCTQDVCNTTSGTCANVDKNCDDGKPCTADACTPTTGQCTNKNDDTLQPPSPCWSDECSFGTPSCKSGALVCSNPKADPAKVGLVCASGEGTCGLSGCIVPKAPVISAASFAAAVKPGTAGALSVVVQDSNTDNASGVSDLASVTADLSAFGGSATTALTAAGPGPDNQSLAFNASVATTGLKSGTYSVPIAATDKSGKIGLGSALLVVYTGTILHVGATEEYTTISAAVNAAASGDTIAIHDGVYAGNANKNLAPGNKVLSIVGLNGPSKVILDCSGSGRAFNLSSSDVAIDLSLSGMTIKGCVASAVRVAIAGTGTAQVKLSDIVFDSNTASDTGGAVDAAGAGATLVASRCTFVNNAVTATSGYPKGGGGISMMDGSLSVTGSTFVGNNAGTAGGGDALLLTGAAVATVKATNFSGHKGKARVVSFLEASGLSLEGCTFSNEGTAGECVAGQSTKGTLTIANSRFEGCQRGVVAWQSTPCTVTGSVFKGNKSAPYDYYGVATFCNVDNSLFANNTGRVFDGRLDGGRTITNSTFLNNDSGYNEVAFLGANSSGLKFINNKGNRIAAIDWIGKGNIVLSDSVFSGNTAAASTVESNSGSVIQNCQFVGNKAANGGAIRASSTSTGEIANVLAVGNTVTGQGGAIQVVSGTWTLRNLTLVGNTAAQGGGLFMGTTKANLDSSILWDNVAAATGGGAQGAQIMVQNASNTSIVLHFCTVRNDDQVAEGDISDDGLKMNGGDSFVAGQLGNLSSNPLFVQTAAGSYFLSQTAAGQAKQSPCVDPVAAGSLTPPLANAVGLDTRTTRTDGKPDSGTVDAGYHYTP
ncbi:MAG: hypothetical protein HY902_12210 [Deltaproteobacteria bacterium]|nr:hypothetical protein [Deltaproteobacteria bacterium]